MAKGSHQCAPPSCGASEVSRIGLVADMQGRVSAGQSSGEPDEPKTPRVAILDCDSGFLAVLTNRIERLGWQYRVLSTRTTQKALASLQADVLIVDLSLLGARRWKWLARHREQRPDVRVIVCAGASTVAERVCALRLGADDWLTKPCHPEELIARVEAVTSHRHRPEPRDLSPVIVGEVEVRPDLYQAFVHGHSVRLTRREYQLIELLSRAGSEIQPREVIYECLWGYKMARNDRSVDVFVHKLRRKLERASPDWHYIHTHFGIGYRLGAERVGGDAELGLQCPQESLVAQLAA
jgi:DNA-binding response OmpR family regulator